MERLEVLVSVTTWFPLQSMESRAGEEMESMEEEVYAEEAEEVHVADCLEFEEELVE
jgi:hypothetical protein